MYLNMQFINMYRQRTHSLKQRNYFIFFTYSSNWLHQHTNFHV